MSKKFIKSRVVVLAGVFLSAFLLSGCSAPNSGGGDKIIGLKDLKGGIILSQDQGTTFEARVKAEEGKNISGVEVQCLAVDPGDSRTIYFGSHENGMFVSKNGGEEWEHMDVSFNNVYGIEVSPYDSNMIYATGVENGRGKIFKSTDGGATWTGVYNEPSNGTFVLSLDMSRYDPNTLYAGTSGGTIIETNDGGTTWKNLRSADKAVRSVAVDPMNSDIVYALLNEDTLLLSRDGGESFDDMKDMADDVWKEKRALCAKAEDKTACSDALLEKPGKVYSFALDAARPGSGYVGTDNGLFRFGEYGATWDDLNTIASSREYPIRVVAVNPYRSQEIFYSSAQALYRSLDGGTNWYTYDLTGSVTPSSFLYDWSNPDHVYVGLRPVKTGGLFGR